MEMNLAWYHGVERTRPLSFTQADSKVDFKVD